MSCKWNNEDCSNENELCDLCLAKNLNYKPTKVRKYGLKPKAEKADKRMGSKFEYKNHVANKELVSTRMTLNSGATGKEKGDEQISGIIEVMEELKTKVAKEAPGKQTFTIRKSWLEKLTKEAIKENKEFWYLKFCFHEDESDEVYVVVESDIIMSMIKTMIEDRKRAKECDAKIAYFNSLYEEELANRRLLEAKLKNIDDMLNLEKMQHDINSMFLSEK